jgi:lipid-binding SYLF domain-containing protein
VRNIIGTLQSLLLLFIIFLPILSAHAASESEINSKVSEALQTLYSTAPGSKALASNAKGILVFPDIVKAGLIVGGQYGDGALRIGGNSVGYALFFMDDASLNYLEKSDGWEIGTGPSVVVLDKGFGKNLSSTTLKKGIYAFIFDQKGLMAGIGLQGSKITKITPDK